LVAQPHLQEFNCRSKSFPANSLLFSESCADSQQALCCHELGRKTRDSLLIPCLWMKFANFGQNSKILRSNSKIPCSFPSSLIFSVTLPESSPLSFTLESPRDLRKGPPDCCVRRPYRS